MNAAESTEAVGPSAVTHHVRAVDDHCLSGCRIDGKTCKFRRDLGFTQHLTRLDNIDTFAAYLTGSNPHLWSCSDGGGKELRCTADRACPCLGHTPQSEQLRYLSQSPFLQSRQFERAVRGFSHVWEPTLTVAEGKVESRAHEGRLFLAAPRADVLGVERAVPEVLPNLFDEKGTPYIYQGATVIRNCLLAAVCFTWRTYWCFLAFGHRTWATECNESCRNMFLP